MTHHRFATANKNSPAAKARRTEYDSAPYRAIRKRLRALIDSGQAYCWRCGRWIPPGTGHTGHNDERTQVMGPEHTNCNLKTAQSKGARVANAQRKGTQPPFTRPTR